MLSSFCLTLLFWFWFLFSYLFFQITIKRTRRLKPERYVEKSRMKRRGIKIKFPKNNIKYLSTEINNNNNNKYINYFNIYFYFISNEVWLRIRIDYDGIEYIETIDGWDIIIHVQVIRSSLKTQEIQDK